MEPVKTHGKKGKKGKKKKKGRRDEQEEEELFGRPTVDTSYGEMPEVGIETVVVIARKYTCISIS